MVTMGLDFNMTNLGGLNDVVDAVKQAIEQSGLDLSPENSLREVVMGFIDAVDWTEPWIRGLVAMHVSLAGVTLLFRRSMGVQLTVFSVCALLVALAQPLNSLGADHWESFSRQAYFDYKGIFISTVLSIPLILIMVLNLTICLFCVFKELVQLKAAQLRAKAKAEARAASVNG